jgi:hypothetical protein
MTSAQSVEVTRVGGRDTDAIRNRILEACRTLNSEYITLAKLLFEVREAELHSKWGFDSFAEYAEEELNLKPRKAEYLVAIADTLIHRYHVSGDSLAEIGWSKAGMIAPVAESTKGAEAWIERAKGVSVKELASQIRTARAKRAAAEAQTSADQPAAPKSEPVSILRVPLFPSQRATVEAALEILRSRTGSDKVGYLLEAMSMEFMAGVSPPAESQSREIELWVGRLGRRFPGHQFLAVRADDENDLRRNLQNLLESLEEPEPESSAA